MDIDKFFLKSINDSAYYQGISMDFGTPEYLLKIMKLPIYGGQELFDKKNTLAEIYMEGLLEEGRTSRFFIHKKIGDLSLIRLGLFPENISKMLSRDYYVQMGSLAYMECFLYKQNSLFKNLSENIEDFSDVIYGAKNSCITNNIVDLYELWTRTRSKFAKRRLFALGFAFSEIEISE
jgi:hypothetical protein